MTDQEQKEAQVRLFAFLESLDRTLLLLENMGVHLKPPYEQFYIEGATLYDSLTETHNG